MGALLKQEELVPQLIITSAARRALATARAVADACGYEEEIEATRTLYMADVQDFLDVLTAVPDPANVVLLVAHNPGLEELLEELTGHWERMPTAALAHITLPIASWQEAAEGVEGELLAVWYPKELPG
jgi:phosphohistidine phosphatase